MPLAPAGPMCERMRQRESGDGDERGGGRDGKALHGKPPYAGGAK